MKHVLRTETLEYRGKTFRIPVFDPNDGVVLRANVDDAHEIDRESRIVLDLNKTFDRERFLHPARPVSLGTLAVDELARFTAWDDLRVLDMPIKFPDNDEYRLPKTLAQFAEVVQRIIDVEHAINAQHRDYFAYLTVDQRVVRPGTLQREAPCHVDGFQGARFRPKVRTNHTYTVSDVLPTAYYLQPFDLGALDEEVHDFFWEMNAQVADTAEAHRFQPGEAEITMMDCYCVHRGVESAIEQPRTWLRLSFEERARVFDRLGNGHNPLFDYDWEMVARDIEALGLVAFRPDSDPSLRVFPWQTEEGERLPAGAPKTKPRLS